MGVVRIVVDFTEKRIILVGNAAKGNFAMGNISLLGQIMAFLSAMGFGGIIGALFGRWLTRGHPRVSLIGVETGMGIYPIARSKPVKVPEDAIKLSRNSQWGINIDDVTTIGELSAVISSTKQFISNSEKILRETGSFLKEISKNGVDSQEMITIIQQLLDNEIVHAAILNGLSTNKLTPRSINRKNQVALHVEKAINRADNNTPYFVIQFPDGKKKGIGYNSRGYLDSNMEHLTAFMDVIRYCDHEGIKNTLNYVKDLLSDQCDLARKIREILQPFIQSTYWQIEVIVANRGDRTVLLSPYAVLTTKGTRHPLINLPLTALLTTPEEAETNKDSQINPAEQDNEPEHSSKYLVLAPQSAHQITFLSDDEVDNKGKYSELHAIYDAGVLECAIVLKREDIHGWRGNSIALRSSWVSFGKGFTKKLRNEIDALAGHRILRWRVTKIK